jgi:hypothetical protein
MLNLEKSINALLAARAHLLNQIDAIDQALAALRRTPVHAAAAAEGAQATPAGPEVTRVAPKRILSDEHKRKLAEGRQRARQAKEVVKGTAREPLDGVPALAAPISEAPRLVKRRPSQDLTVEPDADARMDRREEVTH